MFRGLTQSCSLLPKSLSHLCNHSSWAIPSEQQHRDQGSPLVCHNAWRNRFQICLFIFFYRHLPLRVPHGVAQHRSCSVARQMKGQGLEIVKWAPAFSLNLFQRVWKTKKKKKKHLQRVQNKKEKAKYLHRCIIQVTLHAHSIRALCQTHACCIKGQLQQTFVSHKRGMFLHSAGTEEPTRKIWDLKQTQKRSGKLRKHNRSWHQ